MVSFAISNRGKDIQRTRLPISTACGALMLMLYRAVNVTKTMGRVRMRIRSIFGAFRTVWGCGLSCERKTAECTDAVTLDFPFHDVCGTGQTGLANEVAG